MLMRKLVTPCWRRRLPALTAAPSGAASRPAAGDAGLPNVDRRAAAPAAVPGVAARGAPRARARPRPARGRPHRPRERRRVVRRLADRPADGPVERRPAHDRAGLRARARRGLRPRQGRHREPRARRARREPGRHHAPALQPGPRRDRVLRQRPGRPRHPRRAPHQRLRRRRCRTRACPARRPAIERRRGPRRGAPGDARRRLAAAPDRGQAGREPDHDVRDRRAGAAALEPDARTARCSPGTSSPAAATSISTTCSSTRPTARSCAARTSRSTSARARFFRRDPDATTTAQTQITMPPAWYSEHTRRHAACGASSRARTPIPTTRTRRRAASSAARASRSPRAAAHPTGSTPRATTFPGAPPCPASGCTWNSAAPPTATTNQLQAGANLHVLVSRFHDHLAAAPIGFDEASGNFQLTNAPGQGLGGDYVQRRGQRRRDEGADADVQQREHEHAAGRHAAAHADVPLDDVRRQRLATTRASSTTSTATA